MRGDELASKRARWALGAAVGAESGRLLLHRVSGIGSGADQLPARCDGSDRAAADPRKLATDLRALVILWCLSVLQSLVFGLELREETNLGVGGVWSDWSTESDEGRWVA